MHIEEIILDGFKSYATRTVISGFDPRFNAVTGLNGSGKSNILDAICFVLGITNLSHVRANNLQELVYKQGQAGVTKASVTIIFNNQDTHGSPVGYEQYEQLSVARQVVIGGRNKYMINGHTAQVSQVQNLFHSVQLNVNNPHFLIMQGRITKVLNMKPPEILGMIEEAAGTRMYENKKQVALKTMLKKERKVEEINSILANEITPTLEKLRSEKAHYLKWAANNTEMERLQRYCVAFEYQKALNALNHTAENVESMKQTQLESSKQEEELSQSIIVIGAEADKLQFEREKEMGKEFQKLKENVEKIGKEVVKFTTKVSHCQVSIEQHKATQRNTEIQYQEAQQAVVKLQKIYASKAEIVKGMEEAYNVKEEETKQLQRQIQALNAGMAQTGDQHESLSESLVAKQRELQENLTSIKQIHLKLKHLDTSIAQKKMQLMSIKSMNNDIQNERQQKSHELKNLQQELQTITRHFDPNEESALQSELQSIDDKIRSLSREADDLSSRLSSRLNFNYTDPYKNFNRSSVKGVLAKLLDMKHDWSALALEIAAGGRLYQIVVDNEKTAKDILKFGRLMSRVTIIPLNRINRRTIDSRKVQIAKELAKKDGQGAQVWEALELIHFDPQVAPAMEYAFGSSLICETSSLAKTIAFHRDVKVRTVTLEGDTYDPSGTLQGGSAPSKGNPVLSQLHHWLTATRELESLKQQQYNCRNALEDLREHSTVFHRLQRSIELKEHELRLIDERISDSEHAQLERDLSALEAQYEADKLLLANKTTHTSALEQEVQRLGADIAKMKESRQSQLGVLDNRFRQSKSDLQQVNMQLKSGRQELSELQLEIESVEQECESLNETMSRIGNEINGLQKENEKTQKEADAVQERFDKASLELEARRSHLSKCDEQLKALSLQQSELSKKQSVLEIERKKIEHKIARLIKEEGEAKHILTRLEKTHPWIESEKEFFGREHTDYDFTRRDPGTANRRLVELKETQGALSKKINKKVMGMIEKAEQEYHNLMDKRQIIEKDKQKITSVIQELDTKKNEALEQTWVKVNRDLGSIFKTLLPGTHAKLDPPSNGTILDGLVVRVAFGGVWKESLTELSGGQRSLLALSLILALLLFKPAPMYILDEVDAALDLSHTQNIGQMIRSHFSHSQFIVVSLKEGMFNNANVVFRTKFVDGVSTVGRTVPNKSRGA